MSFYNPSKTPTLQQNILKSLRTPATHAADRKGIVPNKRSVIEMAQTMNLSTQHQTLSGASLLRPTRLQKPFVARPRTVMAVAHQVGIRVI